MYQKTINMTIFLFAVAPGTFSLLDSQSISTILIAFLTQSSWDLKKNCSETI